MKIKDPDWYKKLSPEGQELVDQSLHLILGIVSCAIGGAYLSMVCLYIREFWIQWPVERVEDTRTDMAFWTCGAGIFELIKLIHGTLFSAAS